MVRKIKLSAATRQKTGRQTKSLRREGMIPAVVYGRGAQNQNIKFKYDDFAKAYAQAGESSLVDLDVDGGQSLKAIIKNIQRDSLKGNITHADLYRVDMSQKLEVEVPLNYIKEDESPAVKEKGGMVTKAMDTLYIRCLPGNLPEHVDIDLSQLKEFGDTIRVKDLALDEDIEVLNDPEDYIAGAEEIVERTEEEMGEETEGEQAEGEQAEEGKQGGDEDTQS